MCSSIYLCHTTLRGEVVADGLDKAVERSLAAFAPLGVTAAMLEQQVGRPRAAWTADDVARLCTDYTTLTRDGVPIDEVFETTTVDATALTGRPNQATP